MQTELIFTQRVLSPTQISLGEFVINPYRGCYFKCVYCYTQENKNLKDKRAILGIKINAPERLEKELKYKKVKHILIGSTTECFPPQEKYYRITKRILEILNRHGITYTILTKSSLIEEYLDIISYNKNNKIYFTINFSSDKIIRLLETNTPILKKRLATLDKIRQYGIKLRVHIGPFIPYLSPTEELLSLIKDKTKEINIELYNHRMGNYQKLISLIKKLNPEIADKIHAVYKDNQSYLMFSDNLKIEIDNISKRYNLDKINLVIPEYHQFYTPDIFYE